MITKEELQKQISLYGSLDVLLHLHDSRTVFLRYRKKEGRLHLFLHSIFLSAPNEIIAALALVLQKKDKIAMKQVRVFAIRELMDKDYTHRLKEDRLIVHGKVYNLAELFQEVNEQYFEGRIQDLRITWFKQFKASKKRSLTFGTYQKQLKLIRINGILDTLLCPKSLISFIIYHEILHHLHPVEIDASGRRSIHSKVFKLKQRCFIGYEEAKAEEKKFLQQVFQQRGSICQGIANGLTSSIARKGPIKKKAKSFLAWLKRL